MGSLLLNLNSIEILAESFGEVAVIPVSAENEKSSLGRILLFRISTLELLEKENEIGLRKRREIALDLSENGMMHRMDLNIRLRSINLVKET